MTLAKYAPGDKDLALLLWNNPYDFELEIRKTRDDNWQILIRGISKDVGCLFVGRVYSERHEAVDGVRELLVDHFLVGMLGKPEDYNEDPDRNLTRLFVDRVVGAFEFVNIVRTNEVYWFVPVPAAE